MAKQSKRRDLEQRFLERYSAPTVEAQALVESKVIGVVMGANGYTTRRQADLLAQRLDLGRDSLLLDLGSGRGWPGVYLAKTTGCRAVLSDLPLPALKTARERATDNGLADSVSIVRASATDAPFAARSFDAVSHTDTL
jgi:ubiquinone/menaquinone biosynthesis C-methylase UbiE